MGSVGLVVTRASGLDSRAGRPAIAISEWTQLVAEDEDLRLQIEPYVGLDPKTGAKFQLKPREADAEVRIDGQWLPILRYRGAIS